MKISIAAVLGLVFVGVHFAAAQDPTVTTPTAQSEAANEEPSPAPTPEESATPAAPKKTRARESKTEESSEPAKKTIAVPEPRGGQSAEATLREMENRWMASVVSRDTSVAEAVLADDYAGVSATGKIINKRAKVAQVKSDSNKYESVKISKMDVRVFGNAAVVIGSSTEKGQDGRGQAFDRGYRWTDTWLLRNGRWQCVASQSAPAPK